VNHHQHTNLVNIGDEATRVAQVAVKVLARSLNQAGGPHARPPVVQAISTSQASQLLFDASVNPQKSAVSAAIQELQAASFSDFTLFSEIIPAAVRQLGLAWEDDDLSFFAMTLGASRLQIAVHGLSERELPEGMNYLSKKLSLLIIVPEGTQHTLGAIILGKTLRCVGARVKLEFCVTADRVHEIGAGEQFDGVFISASAQDSAEKLSEITSNVRYNWSKTKVILGGGILNAQINLDAVTGTDYKTNDWKAAVAQCF
jgi:methanogenic corrinoid protein MtbC1